MTYCGVAFDMSIIGGIRRAVECYFWVAIKTCCVQSGQIPKLWCEAELCKAGPWIADAHDHFGETLVQAPHDARVQANRLVMSTTQAQIKAELAQSTKKLKYTDKFFDIDAAFFSCMFGEEGAALLLAKTKSFFDISQKQRPNVETVAQQMEALIASDLFKFTRDAEQNQVSQFNTTVQGLILGSQPVLKQNATEVTCLPYSYFKRSYMFICIMFCLRCLTACMCFEVMKSLHSLLRNLCSWGTSAVDPDPKYGKEAFAEHFKNMLTVNDLAEFEPLRVFAFLGSVEERRAVKTRFAALLKELSEGKPEAKPAKPAAKAGGKVLPKAAAKGAASKASGSAPAA